MKKIKELKTKNSKSEFIILSTSCTCSICGNKIMPGTKFLRIKSYPFGTSNYCSAECMEHPMIKALNLSEECCVIPAEDTHAYTNLFEDEMKNLGFLDLSENVCDSTLRDPNIGISDYDYSPENLRKLIPMEGK